MDIDEGDSLHVKLRSRLIAQAPKQQHGPKCIEEQSSCTDVFAAVPPLSSSRALFALATAWFTGLMINAGIEMEARPRHVEQILGHEALDKGVAVAEARRYRSISVRLGYGPSVS